LTSVIYLFAGHTVSSAFVLLGLPVAPAVCGLADFRVVIEDAGDSLAAETTWQHRWRDPFGNISLSFARCGDSLVLHFPDAAKVTASPDGTVAVSRAPRASDETLCHVLLDQVLPRLLAHRGHLVVHAAAVVDDDRHGIAIIGDSGRGKSTLSAALAASGCRLLSDDCLLLELDERAVHAIPSYPGLRLLPDSLTALYGETPPDTSPVAHYTDKRRLARTDNRKPQPSTVTAMLLLQPPVDSAEIRIDPLSPQQACIELVRNAFQLDLGDMQRASKLLAQAAEITRRVPVFSIAYPRHYAALPNVTEQIRTLISTIAARPPDPDRM
jgi:hypothetical protein